VFVYPFVVVVVVVVGSITVGAPKRADSPAKVGESIRGCGSGGEASGAGEKGVGGGSRTRAQHCQLRGWLVGWFIAQFNGFLSVANEV